MGVFTGGGSVSAITDFGTYLETPMDYAEEFIVRGKTNWNAIEGSDGRLDPWLNTSYRLVLGVPMLPGDTVTSLATGATGSYDSHFTALANKLVANGNEDAIIRLGWGFTGDWYRWAAKDKQTDFINYWRHIANAMRAVSGQKFEFVWNATRNSNWDPMTACPGDDYVDTIAVDWYDNNWTKYPWPRIDAGTNSGCA